VIRTVPHGYEQGRVLGGGSSAIQAQRERCKRPEM